jgi:hypothetical protein
LDASFALSSGSNTLAYLTIEATIRYIALEEAERQIAFAMENRNESERKGWKGLT